MLPRAAARLAAEVGPRAGSSRRMWASMFPHELLRSVRNAA